MQPPTGGFFLSIAEGLSFQLHQKVPWGLKVISPDRLTGLTELDFVKVHVEQFYYAFMKWLRPSEHIVTHLVCPTN